MSLQVWLPLTKDLRQQGLSNTIATNHGTTYQSTGGKLGGCYYFSGSTSSYISTNYQTNIGTSDFSISLWIKIPTMTSGSYYAICTSKTTAATSAGFGIYWNYSQKKFLWSTADGSNATEIWMANTVDTIVYDKWIHLVMVRNSNDTKKGYFYIDGIRYELASVPVIRNITTASNLYLGMCTNSSYAAKMYLNDFRIYDHALSQMEVKELSKGLVLHYPLSDKYIESTTNLITTEDCLSASCFNGATSKYGYGTNTDMYKTVTTFDGRKGTKVYMGTNGNSCYPYVYVNNMFTSNGTNAPTYKTLSFDYYTTISTSISPYKLGNGTGTATYKVTNTINGLKTGTGTNSVVIPIVPNTWNHVEVTFHGTTDANAEWGYIQNQPAHTSNTSNFWFFANMQLETKDHATGYAGVGGVRNATTVYDCSGFCNNGSKWAYDTAGEIICANDTPKYQISTYINSDNNTTNTASGTRYIYGNCELTTPQYLTVVFWCKPIAGYGNNTGQGQFSLTKNAIGTSAGEDYNTCPMNHRDSYIDMCTSSGVHKTVGITFTANEWHHYVVVYDGRYGRVYKDGVVTGQTLDMGSVLPLKDMKGVVIGFSKAGGVWRSNKSYFSDFRIYATALSADDVKSLYQNSAYIDSSGNVYGAVHTEV